MTSFNFNPTPVICIDCGTASHHNEVKLIPLIDGGYLEQCPHCGSVDLVFITDPRVEKFLKEI